MLLSEVIQALQLTCLTQMSEGDVPVKLGYAADLLSDVMGNAVPGSIWVTLQCHPNVVAVASLLNLAAVVIVGKAVPDQQTLQKAEQAGVTLLRSQYTAFETIGRLYQLGISGASRDD
ncbi:MAG: DRTGG domain-containing protein [Bacillota bacterium]|jgi:hypothetical protein